jgi:hypothetical protein
MTNRRLAPASSVQTAEESASFFKKRSKELFDSGGIGQGRRQRLQESKVFASFCSQKEALASLSAFPNGLAVS